MNLQLFAQKKEKKMEDQRTPMPESVESRHRRQNWMEVPENQTHKRKCNSMRKKKLTNLTGG